MNFHGGRSTVIVCLGHSGVGLWPNGVLTVCTHHATNRSDRLPHGFTHLNISHADRMALLSVALTKEVVRLLSFVCGYGLRETEQVGYLHLGIPRSCYVCGNTIRFKKSRKSRGYYCPPHCPFVQFTLLHLGRAPRLRFPSRTFPSAFCVAG